MSDTDAPAAYVVSAETAITGVASRKKKKASAKQPSSKSSSSKSESTTSKSKTKPTHPPVSQMVNAAIISLKERSGSSLQAIKKYIQTNYNIDNIERVIPFIRKYLKTGVTTGTLIQVKGKGAAGSFKLNKGTSKKSANSNKVSRSSISITSIKSSIKSNVKKPKKAAAATTKQPKKPRASKSTKQKKTTKKAAATSPKVTITKSTSTSIPASKKKTISTSKKLKSLRPLPGASENKDLSKSKSVVARKLAVTTKSKKVKPVAVKKSKASEATIKKKKPAPLPKKKTTTTITITVAGSKKTVKK